MISPRGGKSSGCWKGTTTLPPSLGGVPAPPPLDGLPGFGGLLDVPGADLLLFGGNWRLRVSSDGRRPLGRSEEKVRIRRSRSARWAFSSDFIPILAIRLFVLVLMSRALASPSAAALPALRRWMDSTILGRATASDVAIAETATSAATMMATVVLGTPARLMSQLVPLMAGTAPVPVILPKVDSEGRDIAGLPVLARVAVLAKVADAPREGGVTYGRSASEAWSGVGVEPQPGRTRDVDVGRHHRPFLGVACCLLARSGDRVMLKTAAHLASLVQSACPTKLTAGATWCGGLPRFSSSG
jgi:hypothetical protein